MRIDGDHPGMEVILSTGRRFGANRGLLCPAENGDLCEGYDGTVERADAAEAVAEGWSDDPVLTPAERREIADYMIAHWNAWAAK